MVIGLTGGIASGKSTAAQLLASWGAYMIDADKLGHKAYLQGTTAYQQVIATFGEDVVAADGEIDRAALGAKVFGEDSRLGELTAIVWPAIRQMAEDEIRQCQQADPAQIIVLEAAVLIEAGWQDLVDQVWVTVVAAEVAITRACSRDGSGREAVQARIDAQLSNDQRRAVADQVIDNSADPAQLSSQLQGLWNKLTTENPKTKT